MHSEFLNDDPAKQSFREQSRIDLLRCVLQIERLHLAEGISRKEAFARTESHDYFNSGNPFHFTIHNSTVRLFSVGEDSKDDGGAPDKDIVISLPLSTAKKSSGGFYRLSDFSGGHQDNKV